VNPTPRELSWSQVHAFRLERHGPLDRDHIVEPANLSKVSHAAGWISAVVLVDGQVAETWTHVAARDTLRVDVEPFRRLSAKTAAEVRRRAESLAEVLGLAKAEVRVA
jgi:Winged helix DNA-binding domain